MESVEEFIELLFLSGAIGPMVSLIVGFIILTVWIKFIKLIINECRRSYNRQYFKSNVRFNDLVVSPDKSSFVYHDIDKAKLSEFNTDNLLAFKDYFYQIFLNFENALNSMDYEMMKYLSSPQVFQNYHLGMKLDSERGIKRIIDNINRKEVIVYETLSSSVKQVVSVYIEIEYVNYVINNKGEVISGDRYKKITEQFEVTFKNDYSKDVDVKRCPTCGAPVTKSKCEYCRNPIPNSSFKICNIKRIVNR